jgi:hypothetical protein
MRGSPCWCASGILVSRVAAAGRGGRERSGRPPAGLWLVAGFGLGALLLAADLLYGVISYSVARRSSGFVPRMSKDKDMTHKSLRAYVCFVYVCNSPRRGARCEGRMSYLYPSYNICYWRFTAF